MFTSHPQHVQTATTVAHTEHYGHPAESAAQLTIHTHPPASQPHLQPPTPKRQSSSRNMQRHATVLAPEQERDYLEAAVQLTPGAQPLAA
jgi:hypothetical protein